MNGLSVFSEILNETRSIVNELMAADDFLNCTIDVLVDSEYSYRAIIDFGNCLGEVIVNQPDFAPYRYVKIEILSSIEEISMHVFFWGDSESDDVNSVRENIVAGFRTALNYKKPNG